MSTDESVEEGAERARSFHELVREEDVDAVARWLADDPGAVDLRDHEGRTPLHGCRHLEIVRALLEAGAEVDARDDSGFTPLHRVQISGSSVVTQELLARGADIASVDVDGWTSLHAAATFLGLDSVKMLLEHGADESATNKRGYTALHEALDDGNDLNARFLWQRTLRCDPWVAAGLDDVTQLRVLLTESPAHLTAVDGRGRTPLHWAARCGALESTRILIEAGAPLEARDECGSTPLYWAAAGYPAFEGFGPNTTSLDIARLLVEGGASHDCVNDAGKRPIDFVTQKWKPALASWLESLDR